MSFAKLTAVIAVTALVAGCATRIPLSREQVARISTETSAADLDAILGKATVSSEYDFDANGRKYHARHLQLQTGTRTETTMACAKTCFPVYTPVAVTADYLVVQEQPSRRLLGWGTIEELSKSPDERLASIMPALKQVDAERQASAKK
jgi:hypothetical protein